MAKSDTVKAIKEKFGADVDEALSQKKLDSLLAAADKPAFDALLANLNDGDPSNDPAETQDPAAGSSEAASETSEGKKRVKLGARAGADTTLLHPTDKVTIGAKAVLVTYDDWTIARIRNEELELG